MNSPDLPNHEEPRRIVLNHERAAEEKSTTSAATPKGTIKTRENRPKREDELI